VVRGSPPAFSNYFKHWLKRSHHGFYFFLTVSTAILTVNLVMIKK